jgi:hypothetical protein
MAAASVAVGLTATTVGDGVTVADVARRMGVAVDTGVSVYVAVAGGEVGVPVGEGVSVAGGAAVRVSTRPRVSGFCLRKASTSAPVRTILS